MKYILLMSGTPDDGLSTPAEWTPDEMAASWAHMGEIHRELTEAGELLGGEGLAGPETAKTVTSDGAAPPLVTDGPFPEAKEFLVGFWLIDVASEARAIEIAARTSAAPGPGGRPTAKPIEIRPLMGGPEPEW
jgi:hypothetical protein